MNGVHLVLGLSVSEVQNSSDKARADLGHLGYELEYLVLLVYAAHQQNGHLAALCLHHCAYPNNRSTNPYLKSHQTNNEIILI
jgi:hypothetical protein